VKGLNLQQVRVERSDSALRSNDPKGEAKGRIILHAPPSFRWNTYVKREGFEPAAGSSGAKRLSVYYPPNSDKGASMAPLLFSPLKFPTTKHP